MQDPKQIEYLERGVVTLRESAVILQKYIDYLKSSNQVPIKASRKSRPKRFSTFLLDTYKTWYPNTDQSKLDQASKKTPQLINPKSENYQTKKADINASNFGEYTLNPDTYRINWDTIDPAKIEIKSLPATLNGKSLAEVADYINKTYSATHYLPGIEYWEYAFKNPTKVPQSMKDGDYPFLFGSLIRGADGEWSVPYLSWGGGTWKRGGSWLDNGWDSNCRVVLLKK